MNFYWIASFNNGERISSKNLDEDVTGAWHKLIASIKSNKFSADGKEKKITHVELIVNGRRYSGPSSSKHASFPSTDVDNFWILCRIGAELRGGGEQDFYCGISYRLGDYRHVFWVNTKNNFCYTQFYNVVNPSTKFEKDFAGVDSQIAEDYQEAYAS